MVISDIVMLEAIPLTANGKIDHKALPKPSYEQDPSFPFLAPRTELEKKIAAIWGNLLDIEKIDIRDNFNSFRVRWF